MIKIYISPSCQDKNVGYGAYGSEESRMNQVADVVVRELKKTGQFDIVRNRPEMTLSQVVANSNASGAKYHIAIHSNAGGGRGCEIYAYKPEAEGDRLAHKIYARLSAITPSADRGIKYQPHWDEVWKTRAVAVLIEIAFHDNAGDAEWIMKNIEPIGREIARGICEHCGVRF